jgi:hypothetical protein
MTCLPPWEPLHVYVRWPDAKRDYFSSTFQYAMSRKFLQVG